MDRDPSRMKGWETIAKLPFDEQIIFLSSAPLPDFIKGVCEVLHGASINEVKTGACREASLPSYRDNSGNTVTETLYAMLTAEGFLELTSYRSVKTPVHLELESDWRAVKQRTDRGVGLPVWELREAGDGAEIFAEEIEPSEQEQLDFRVRFIEALTRKEAQRNKVGIETARIVNDYL